MAIAEFDPRRFRTAAAHYRAGRPGYAPILIRRVAHLCGLAPAVPSESVTRALPQTKLDHERFILQRSWPSRVLDLGCGPGLLAVAFAPFAAEVVAMDPEPEMLAEVADQGVPNIRPVRGSSFDLRPELGPFRLVTMGRSFHWMDRAATLQCLDEMVESEGAIALFFTVHPDVPENAWAADYRALRRRYASAELLPSHSPGWLPHESVLLDSPFCHLEGASVIERRRVTIGALVERALSMSGTSPARLGARLDAFRQEIEDLLAGHGTDGSIAEVIESRALIGFRPGERPA